HRFDCPYQHGSPCSRRRCKVLPRDRYSRELLHCRFQTRRPRGDDDPRRQERLRFQRRCRESPEGVAKRQMQGRRRIALPDHDESSRERLTAAATARVSSSLNPPFPISNSSAAAVVPLGEVTFSLSFAALRSERLTSAPAPETVARANLFAISASSPASRPASARHSVSRNT